MPSPPPSDTAPEAALPEVSTRLQSWEREGAVGRLWAQDPALWAAEPVPEISDRLGETAIHVQALNTLAAIPPQRGRSPHAVVRRNLEAIRAQSAKTGQPMLALANHPNYLWALTAEDLLKVEGLTHFEVFNGHPAVRNYGDETHPSTERLWDILLAHRLGSGRGPLYGVAADDSHHYHEFASSKANPGRAWIMARAAHLTPESILNALATGDFYATTGIVLDGLECDGAQLRLSIRPEPGFPVITEFIGTRRHSDAIGQVLAEARGLRPVYTFAGDELYVRARLVSSKPQDNPFAPGDVETAWSQPFVPWRPTR